MTDYEKNIRAFAMEFLRANLEYEVCCDINDKFGLTMERVEHEKAIANMLANPEEDYLSYEDLVKEVEGLPMTMLPALMVRAAVAGYKAGSFVPGGASTMIQRIEGTLHLGKEETEGDEKTDSGSDERLPPTGEGVAREDDTER